MAAHIHTGPHRRTPPHGRDHRREAPNDVSFQGLRLVIRDTGRPGQGYTASMSWGDFLFTLRDLTRGSAGGLLREVTVTVAVTEDAVPVRSGAYVWFNLDYLQIESGPYWPQNSRYVPIGEVSYHPDSHSGQLFVRGSSDYGHRVYKDADVCDVGE